MFVNAVAGEDALDIEMLLQGQADLLEIILAANALGGATDALHRGQQHRHQDRDDGDDDQQFEQRKSEALTQLWQRKSAKPLTLFKSETAPFAGKHELKNTISSGNCEP